MRVSLNRHFQSWLQLKTLVRIIKKKNWKNLQKDFTTLLLDTSSVPTETVDGAYANAGGNAIGIESLCCSFWLGLLCETIFSLTLGRRRRCCMKRCNAGCFHRGKAQCFYLNRSSKVYFTIYNKLFAFALCTTALSEELLEGIFVNKRFSVR